MIFYLEARTGQLLRSAIYLGPDLRTVADLALACVFMHSCWAFRIHFIRLRMMHAVERFVSARSPAMGIRSTRSRKPVQSLKHWCRVSTDLTPAET